MYYSYVIQSFDRTILYKGSTDNLERRLSEHNSGQSTYTSKKGPWTLVLSEEHATRALAVKREKWYKTGIGREWIRVQLLEK